MRAPVHFEQTSATNGIPARVQHGLIFVGDLVMKVNLVADLACTEPEYQMGISCKQSANMS